MNPERRQKNLRRNFISGAAALSVFLGACYEPQPTAVPQAFKNNCDTKPLQTIALSKDLSLEARMCGNQTGVMLVNRTSGLSADNLWVEAAFSPSNSQSVSDTFTYKSGDNKQTSVSFSFKDGNFTDIKRKTVESK